MNRIVIDASDVIGRIDPRIYGHFIENMARCIYGGILENERTGHPLGPWRFREGLLREASLMNVPVLRWPGGLYADGYYWREGIGPVEMRPLRRNRYWAFGTDEFMEFARNLDAEPYVNVNMGTGSAAEAASWVQYVNGDTETWQGSLRAEFGNPDPWDVRLWGLGNEMYGFWALGHMGASEYGRRYLEYRAAMTEVDRDLDFVAVGADHYLNETWNKTVLEGTAPHIDLLSIHVYLPGMERLAGVLYSRAVRGKAGLYKAIVSAPLEIERRLLEAEKDLIAVMGRNHDCGLALDEWNLWWKPSQLLWPRWSVRDALYVCGVFHALHRMSRVVRVANIAQMVNVLGVLLARGDNICRTAIYYPFLLYGDAGESHLRSSVECCTYSSPPCGGIPSMSDVPVLDCSATAAKDGKVLTLFIINRSMEENVEVEICIRGFSPDAGVRLRCLNAPRADSYNDFSDDEVVRIETRDCETDEVIPRFRAPAHSVSALAFKRT